MDFISKAFSSWYESYPRRQTDDDVKHYLNHNLKPGWLKRAREALFLSTGKVAEKLQISRAAYANLEKNEKLGSITLKSMARAAEAMNCELIYALRPKKKISFSEIIWNELLQESIDHPWVQSRPKNKKAEALTYIAKIKMEDSKFRQKQGWSKRG